MIMKFRYIGIYIIKAQILCFVLFLSGPSRLKDYVLSGSNNFDVNDEKEQENLGKLLFSAILFSVKIK